MADLRRLANPPLLGQDVRDERFVERTLQIAIVRDVVEHRLDDLLLFVDAVRRQM